MPQLNKETYRSRSQSQVNTYYISWKIWLISLVNKPTNQIAYYFWHFLHWIVFMFTWREIAKITVISSVVFGLWATRWIQRFADYHSIKSFAVKIRKFLLLNSSLTLLFINSIIILLPSAWVLILDLSSSPFSPNETGDSSTSHPVCLTTLLTLSQVHLFSARTVPERWASLIFD